MKKCKICKGNCDSGELIGNICPECMEKEKQQQRREDTIVKMMNSPAEQMKLEMVE